MSDRKLPTAAFIARERKDFMGAVRIHGPDGLPKDLRHLVPYLHMTGVGASTPAEMEPFVWLIDPRSGLVGITATMLQVADHVGQTLRGDLQMFDETSGLSETEATVTVEFQKANS